jgi:hypothetical protein
MAVGLLAFPCSAEANSECILYAMFRSGILDEPVSSVPDAAPASRTTAPLTSGADIASNSRSVCI